MILFRPKRRIKTHMWATRQATAKALIQSNNNLITNAGGIQGVKMGLFFGIVDAFQWVAHAF